MLSKTHIDSFLNAYYKEKSLKSLEDNLTTFISNKDSYQEFIDRHLNLDVHMGVENDSVMYLKHIYTTLQTLCKLLGVAWTLDPLEIYFKKSQEAFNDSYVIYELHMSEIVQKMDKLIKPILNASKQIILNQEYKYWINHNLFIVNMIVNYDRDNSDLYIEFRDNYTS